MSGEPTKEERRQTASFLLGISSGWEGASQRLRELSGQRYSESRDKDAETLRYCADLLEKEAQSKRRYYDDYCSEHGLEGSRTA